MCETLRAQVVLGTMLHELAHIRHQNHGPGFQQLLQELTAVRRAPSCVTHLGCCSRCPPLVLVKTSL